MPEINMNDFLSKLGKETVQRINKEKKAYSRPVVQEEKPKEELTSQKPKIKKPTTSNMLPPKPKVPKPSMTEEHEILLEEEADKALKFGSIMISTIKNTFETDQGRRMAYEAVRTAVNMILGEQKQQYHIQQPVSVQPQKAMSEAEFDSMPTVQEETNPIYEDSQPSGYTRDMGIRSDGKNVDLSNVSSKDISDFKALAGI